MSYKESGQISSKEFLFNSPGKRESGTRVREKKVRQSEMEISG